MLEEAGEGLGQRKRAETGDARLADSLGDGEEKEMVSTEQSLSKRKYIVGIIILKTTISEENPRNHPRDRCREQSSVCH